MSGTRIKRQRLSPVTAPFAEGIDEIFDLDGAAFLPGFEPVLIDDSGEVGIPTLDLP